MNELRIITSKQKADGYLEKVGDFVIRREYKVISHRDDGTYVVRQPKPEAQPLFADH
jgi:hypothetical protein